MNIKSFNRLVYIFRGTGRLYDTIHVCIEEQLTIFLYGIGHNKKKSYFKMSNGLEKPYRDTLQRSCMQLYHDMMISLYNQLGKLHERPLCHILRYI